ncbi:MAG TPA: RNA methyltransferase, partial [Lachnospiraceae bacterium]|nr:RNA methyltransferase [Lachnospiraceae bacterium]
AEYLKEEASGTLQGSGGTAVLYGDDLYLAPEGVLIQGLRVLRPGLHLGTVKKDRFEPAHALAMALRPAQVRQSIEFPDNTAGAHAFLRGESFPCDPLLKGWVLITTGGVSMGWAKAAGGMLKNHYPKGLRRPY